MSELQFRERLIASKSPAATLRIAVAVPHYKHRRYLEVVLASIFAQTTDAFEIIISDDTSPDDSNAVIPHVLEQSGRAFQYFAQERNLGYDRNVRFCLKASVAPYVMLLGNDDALASPTVLENIISALSELGSPDVALTNYRDWSDTNRVVRRVFGTSVLGSGVPAALANFRAFSFVSGAIYKRSAALEHETDRWDASVFYQIYLACRIMAAGGCLAGIDCVAVAKDVLIDGQPVPSYATKFRTAGWTFKPRDTGLLSVMRVTIHGILPYVPAEKAVATTYGVLRQTLLSSYLFWLCEYRRVANWAHALGLARGVSPKHLLEEYSLPPRIKGKLWLLYILVTVAGLFVPLRLATAMRRKVAEGIRFRLQQRSLASS